MARVDRQPRAELRQEVLVRPLEQGEVRLAHAIELECFSVEEAESLAGFETRWAIAPQHFLGAFLLRPSPAGEDQDPSGWEQELVGFTCGTLFAHSQLDLSAMVDPSSHSGLHPYLVIHSLCTLPSHRGKRIADGLMGATLQVARREGRRGARLMCHGALVGMYERWGWETAGRTEIEYGAEGEEWWEMLIDFS